MELIKQFLIAIGPAALTMGNLLWAITLLFTRTHRLDVTDRKTILYIMKLTTLLVEHGSLPPQVLVDQVKDLGEFLTTIPQDDLIQHIVTKQLGAK